MSTREVLGTLVAIGLGLAIFVIFPIISAILINRKGQKGWAIATIITTFIGYGWLVGLIGLTRPSRKEVTLTEKCPFCGGGTGIAENRTVDKTTGKSIASIYGVISWSVFGLIFIGLGATMAILIWSEGDSGFIKWNYGPVVAGIGYLGFGIGIGRIGLERVMEYIKADRINTQVLRCNNCKKEWNQYSLGSIKASQSQQQAALQATPAEVVPVAEQQPEAPVIREMCWFCQKNRFADGKSHQVVLFKSQDGQRVEQTILVPRCSSCQAFHMQKQPLVTAILTGAIIGFMVLCILLGTLANDTLGVWAWVIGTVISLVGIVGSVAIVVAINHRKATAAGTRPIATANATYPQVQELTKEGWKLDTTKSGTT